MSFRNSTHKKSLINKKLKKGLVMGSWMGFLCDEIKLNRDWSLVHEFWGQQRVPFTLISSNSGLRSTPQQTLKLILKNEIKEGLLFFIKKLKLIQILK